MTLPFSSSFCARDTTHSGAFGRFDRQKLTLSQSQHPRYSWDDQVQRLSIVGNSATDARSGVYNKHDIHNWRVSNDGNILSVTRGNIRKLPRHQHRNLRLSLDLKESPGICIYAQRETCLARDTKIIIIRKDPLRNNREIAAITPLSHSRAPCKVLGTNHLVDIQIPTCHL